MSHRPVRQVLAALALVGLGIGATPLAAQAAAGGAHNGRGVHTPRAPHALHAPHAPKRAGRGAAGHAKPKSAPKEHAQGLTKRERRVIARAWLALHASRNTVLLHNLDVKRASIALFKRLLAATPRPDRFIIDYAWTKPNPSAIRAAGYQGVMRYLSHTPTKDISPGERAALHANRLSIGLNWETNETRPLQGGNAGWQDAKEANARADQLGAPKNVAIYFSCDTDVADPSAVRPYYRAARAASRRPIGVYAENAIVADELRLGIAKYGWVTNSTSWGPQGVPETGALKQFYGTQHLPTIAGSLPTRDYDENLVKQADWGQWKP